MKTLDELQDAIRSQDVGSVTLSLAANGKAMVSATFAPTFKSKHEWGENLGDAVSKLFPVVDDDEDLL